MDLWIELLHSLDLEPTALMAFALVPDFEGDQWTFVKPSPTDLQELYGIDVQELTIWRPLVDHVSEQIELGRVVLVEVDAFHLPDTAGVSHGIEHTKTTIAARTIDSISRELGYFHNAGYFTLSGGDFDGVFALSGGSTLAPYTEIAKISRVERLPLHSSASARAACWRRI